MQACMRTYLQACMHTYIHAYVYTQTHRHVCRHADMHICIPTNIHTHPYTPAVRETSKHTAVMCNARFVTSPLVSTPARGVMQ